MKGILILAVSLSMVMSLFLAACAPEAAPAPAPAPGAAPAPAPAASPAKEAWQVKWDSMVEGAKKEGKVVIYSSASAEARTAFQRGFKVRFGINAEFMTGQSAELGPKILAERRAGLRLSDLLTGSGTSLILVLKPAGLAEPIEVGSVLILPEFSDPKLWLGGKLYWADQDAGTHLSLTYSRYEMHTVARNTELVKEGEIQSYNDLLNPKWKGKIVMSDPTKAGRGLKAVAMPGRYMMGWDWVRALAKQEPLILTDPRLQAEWLARGKYAIAYGARTTELYEFRKMGLPVDVIQMREGAAYLAAGTGVVSLLKDAAHPSAARLFLNWLLTREGQTAFSRASGYPSVRLDVSDEGLEAPRAPPDSKAPSGDSEQAILQQDEDLKIIKEIFAPLLGK